VVAVLDFGAWLVALTATALAGCFYVNRKLLVHSLCSLSERQLHKVLWEKNQKCLMYFIGLKGPMSWPFLLIIIPLLRYTRIDLYCAVFQNRIGFSYSISV